MRLDHNQTHPNTHDHRARQSANGSSPQNGADAGPIPSLHPNGSAAYLKSSGKEADMNGFSHHQNGHSSSSALSIPQPNTEPFYGHDREEVTRILLQSLSDLGYHQAAKKLSDESGFALEIPSAAAFRSAVLSGDWDTAELLLFGLEDAEGGGVLLGNGHNTTTSPSWRKNRFSFGNGSQNGFARHPLPLAESADISALKFLIRQQKYLELLERQDVTAALYVLRNELAPLKRDIGRLHNLTTFMMLSPTAFYAAAAWDGAAGSSRSQLLSELSKSISPSIMIPEHRMATLLTAVQADQILACRYHNTDLQPSLYTDHECSADDFPLQPLTELRAHEDEVWYLEFSHDGSMLATAGKDGLVCVFDTVRWNKRHEFREHERTTTPAGDRGVCCVAFSPDDQYLISCSQNNEFAVVNVCDGRCVARADHFDYPVTSAAWLPDSQSFIIGTQGSRRPLGLYSLRPNGGSSSSSSTSNGGAMKSHEIHSFRDPPWDPNSKDQMNSFRITDVAVSPAGDRLAATTIDCKILLYNLLTRQKIAEWHMEDKLTSINFDARGEEMLVNMHRGKVLLLSADVDALGSGRGRDVVDGEVKCRYEGVVQEDFVIRSCFGGAGQGVVVSGSEDSRVYIWRRQTGVQVAALEAHSPGTVNAVAWHPTNPGIFASAGDDRRVRIWAAASSMRPQSADIAATGGSRSALGLYSAPFANR